jgi:hypothetical protein
MKPLARVFARSPARSGQASKLARKPPLPAPAAVRFMIPATFHRAGC